MKLFQWLNFARTKDFSFAYIEYMDVGSTNGWKMDEVITKKEIYTILKEHFTMQPVDPNYYGEVAKRYSYKDNQVDVGFITSVSESFCSNCTRSRLSANGQIFTCLFNGNGHDIRDFMGMVQVMKRFESGLSDIWQWKN